MAPVPYRGVAPENEVPSQTEELYMPTLPRRSRTAIVLYGNRVNYCEKEPSSLEGTRLSWRISSPAIPCRGQKEEPRLGADKQATIAQSAQTPSEAFSKEDTHSCR